MPPRVLTLLALAVLVALFASLAGLPRSAWWP